MTKTLLIIELITTCVIYILFYYLKSNTLSLTIPYNYFLFVYIITWLVASNYFIGSKKINTRLFSNLIGGASGQFITVIFTLSLICSIQIFSNISRLFLLKIVVGAFILKSLIFIFIQYDWPGKATQGKNKAGIILAICDLLAAEYFL